MQHIRNFLAVIGVVACLYVAFWAYDFFAPKKAEPPKDVFDWSVTATYPSPDGIVEAVVNYGVSNTLANTVPIYKVTLQTRKAPEQWMHNVEVWSSQSRQPPFIKWQSKSSLVIHQPPSTLYHYEPEAKLKAGTYRVTLNVRYQQP
jgi:hypothetical protein